MNESIRHNIMITQEYQVNPSSFDVRVRYGPVDKKFLLPMRPNPLSCVVRSNLDLLSDYVKTPRGQLDTISYVKISLSNQNEARYLSFVFLIKRGPILLYSAHRRV